MCSRLGFPYKGQPAVPRMALSRNWFLFDSDQTSKWIYSSEKEGNDTRKKAPTKKSAVARRSLHVRQREK